MLRQVWPLRLVGGGHVEAEQWQVVQDLLVKNV